VRRRSEAISGYSLAATRGADPISTQARAVEGDTRHTPEHRAGVAHGPNSSFTGWTITREKEANMTSNAEICAALRTGGRPGRAEPASTTVEYFDAPEHGELWIARAVIRGESPRWFAAGSEDSGKDAERVCRRLVDEFFDRDQADPNTPDGPGWLSPATWPAS
jgi:hypothetical protein